MKKMKLLVAALLLVGCSKDNANSEGENHQSFVFPKEIVRNYTQKNYEGGNQVINSYIVEEEYQIQDGKILASTYTRFKGKKKEEALKMVYFYENDLPKTFVTTDLESGAQIRKTTYTYQGGKLIEKNEEFVGNTPASEITTYKYEGGKLVKIEDEISKNEKKITTFTYPSDTEIKKTESIVDADGVPIMPKSTTIYTLDNQKRIIKSVSGDITYEYQYDDKKNISYTSLVLSVFPDYFIEETLMKNNLVHTKLIVDDKEMETTQYNYQYNSNGYPTRVVKEIKERNQSSSETSITEFTY